MKKLTLSLIHITIAIIAFTSSINCQTIEIVAYRLVPSQDPYCQIKIEVVEPVTFTAMPDVYKREILEVLIDRAVFEQTNPFAINEPFQVDDKFYHLVQIPNTGDMWYQGVWNHSE